MKTRILIIALILSATTMSYGMNPYWSWAHSSGSAVWSQGNHVVTDVNGNSYVTGVFTDIAQFGSFTLGISGGGPEVFIAKYDPAGNVLWAKGSSGGSGITWYGNLGTSITVDNSGFVYVTGQFSTPTVTFGTYTLVNTGSYGDIFLLKMDASSNYIWVKKAIGQTDDRVSAVTTDPYGNIYITGLTNSPSITFGSIVLSGVYYYIAKYDPSGNALWARGTLHAIGSDVACDQLGNVYVIGSYYTSVTFGSTTFTATGTNDIFIVKYDASGIVQWAKEAGGTSDQRGVSIAFDGFDYLYITGWFSSPTITFGGTILTRTGSSSLYVAKYNSSGTVFWAKTATAPTFSSGYNIICDENGNPAICGIFSGSAMTIGNISLSNQSGSGHDVFAAGFDQWGNALWGICADGINGDQSRSIACGWNNKYYITGGFIGPSITFGSSTLINTGGAAKRSNYFIAGLVSNQPVDSCPPGQIIATVHTGLGGGTVDPVWKVVAGPTAGFSSDALIQYGYSPPALAGSNWIVAKAPAGMPYPAGDYTYEASFDLGQGCPPYFKPELKMAVLATNASVYLNNHLIGYANSQTVYTSITDQTYLNLSGANTISVVVPHYSVEIPVLDVKSWVCCVPDSTPQIYQITCPFDGEGTTFYANTITDYNCNGTAVCPGKEAIYSLSVPGPYNITATVLGSATTRLFVFTSMPNPSSALTDVIACGDPYSNAVFASTGPATYYLVIDNLWPGQHNFGISVRCEQVTDCDSCHYPNPPVAWLHTGGVFNSTWVVTSSPAGSGSTSVVSNPGSYGIPNPLPGSNWIAGPGSTMYTTAGTYVYENSFMLINPAGCLCGPNRIPQLRMCILAADATVSLNGNTIGSVSSLTTPLNIVTIPGQYLDCSGGLNTLKVEVSNQSGSYPVIDVKAWICCADTIPEIECSETKQGNTKYTNKITSAEVLGVVQLPGYEAVFLFNLSSPSHVTITSSSSTPNEEILLVKQLPLLWPMPGQILHPYILAYGTNTVPVATDIYNTGQYYIIIDNTNSSGSHFYKIHVDCEPIPSCEASCQDIIDVFPSGITSGGNQDDVHWENYGYGPAQVVSNPAVIGWSPPQPGSQWISNSSAPLNGTSLTVFKHLFPIPDTCTDPYLSLCLMGDNAMVFLNQIWIGTTNSVFVPENMTNTVLLNPGATNELLVVNLNMPNMPPGMDIIGSVCCTQPLGIKDQTGEKHFKVYPNPAQDNVMIESNLSIESLALYNSMSVKLFEIHSAEELAKINLNDIPSGMYFLVISTRKGVFTEKVIIAH